MMCCLYYVLPLENRFEYKNHSNLRAEIHPQYNDIPLELIKTNDYSPIVFGLSGGNGIVGNQ